MAQKKTLAQAKAEARTLARKGNELGWKAVVGRVTKGNRNLGFAVQFQPSARAESLGRGARFEPIAAYASFKPNPTGAAQKKRRQSTRVIKNSVEAGGIYFGEAIDGRQLSVGPYQAAVGRPSYALFVANAPITVSNPGDVVAQFMAMAKPETIRPSGTTAARMGMYLENPTGSIPKTVERYHAEHVEKGLPEDQAWAVAWSRYCRYKKPESGHCRMDQGDYFPGRLGKGAKRNPTKALATVIEIVPNKGPAMTLGGDGIWQQADRALKELAMSIRHDQQLRADVRIAFDDGNRFEDTITVSRESVRGASLSQAIKEGLTFISGRGAPATMTPAAYEKALKAFDPDGQVGQWAASLLDTADFGPGRLALPVKHPSVTRKKPSGRAVVRKFPSKKPSSKKASGSRKAKDILQEGYAEAGAPIGADPEQIAKGIHVELEHTNDLAVARKIAYDHLTEDPKYYDKLETIENAPQSAFERALQAYLHHAQRLIADDYAKSYKNLTPPRLDIERGKRYIRVVRKETFGAGTSAHSFIDTVNGDVLKAASWKSPAKGARGNIFTDDYGITASGPRYYEIKPSGKPLSKKPTPKKPSSKKPTPKKPSSKKPTDPWDRAMQVGQTLENDVWRLHRYADSLRITSLRNAGKRGKQVLVLTVPLDLQSKVQKAAARRVTDAEMIDLVPSGPNVFKEYSRGIDVLGHGEKKIEVEGLDFHFHASPQSFLIRQHDMNLTSAIPPMRREKAAIKQMYAFARANESRMPAMNYRQLRAELKGIEDRKSVV